MKNEIQLQSDLKEKLEAIKHPNIHVEIYPQDRRLENFDRADVFNPLSPKTFVLFKLYIINSLPGFKEYSEFVFLYKYIFITSSMGLDFYDKDYGGIDARSSTCKLLYERTGLKGFELIMDEITNEQQLVLHLNDGNAFRSVKFESEEKIPENFISLLNESLKINKWL